jgi:ABC-2 type transport system permease protein
MTMPQHTPPPPQLSDRSVGPLRELIWSRLLEFCREPEVIFWVYGFPILMVLALGIAFRERPVENPRVAIVENAENGPAAEAAKELLSDTGFEASLVSQAGASEQLRTGRIDLMVEPGAGNQVTFRFDPTRPEAVLARDRAATAMERSAGREDRLSSADQLVEEPGSRYIDFLIPGLMGLSLMGGGLWGVGFVTVEMRIRGLLKRFLATPMRRWEFLLAVMTSRMLFMIPEMLLIVLFSGWLFGVRIYGSSLAVAFLVVLGSTTFAGLGLLAASRARTLETVSGLLNVIMLPMWLGSGVFFARERYPEAIQPLLALLPLSALVDAMRGVMLEGLSLMQVFPSVATLLVWACVSFTIALRVFRWR